MKKLNLFLGLGAICLAMLFSSCEDVTHSAPVITVDQDNPLILGIGVSSATLTGTIVAEAKLQQVTLHKTVGSSTSLIETITDFDSGEITTTDDVNYTFRFEIDGITEETTIEITAMDKDDQDASESVVIQVTAGNPVDSYTAILMGGQSNATVGSFLDASEGDVYLIAAANTHSELIDVVYYYGSSNLATLTAPDDVTVNGGAGNLSLCTGFTTKNETRFTSSSLSGSEFDDIENDADIADITGINESKMVNLSVGDVIAFETVDGNKGLIKVAAITTGNTGTITIDVKIQQ